MQSLGQLLQSSPNSQVPLPHCGWMHGPVSTMSAFAPAFGLWYLSHSAWVRALLFPLLVEYMMYRESALWARPVLCPYSWTQSTASMPRLLVRTTMDELPLTKEQPMMLVPATPQ